MSVDLICICVCVCVWLRRSKTIKNVPAEKDIRMKKLGDKLTNSMDLPCSLDGSGLWKFHRWTSTITGAGGKVGERVSLGEGEAFPLLVVVNLTCSLEPRLWFQNLCQVFLTWTPAIRAAGKRWRIRGQNQGPAVSVCRNSECGFNLYMCVCD